MKQMQQLKKWLTVESIADCLPLAGGSGVDCGTIPQERRDDVAFAKAEVYEYLEARDIGYAIRLPANEVLQERISHLFRQPVGDHRISLSFGRVLRGKEVTVCQNRSHAY